MKAARKTKLISVIIATLAAALLIPLSFGPYVKAAPGDHGFEIKATLIDGGTYLPIGPLVNNSTVQPGDLILLEYNWVQGTGVGPDALKFVMTYDSANISLPFGKVCNTNGMKTEADGGLWPAPPPSPPLFQPRPTNWSLDCNSATAGRYVVLAMDTTTMLKLTKSGFLVSEYFQISNTVPPGSILNFDFSPLFADTNISTSAPLNLTNVTLNVFEEGLSSDATLGSLTVKDQTNSTTYILNPTFTAGTKPTSNTYSTVVPYATDSVNIAATANHSEGTLLPDNPPLTNGPGLKNLSVGSNSFFLTVVAENGLVEIYQIDILRLSNDANLSSLSLSGITLAPAFNPATTSYSMTVPFATNTTTVSATTNYANATIDTGTGTWNLNNLAPAVNTRNIIIEAENCKYTTIAVPGNTCTSKTYTIDVTRTAPSTNADLATLSVQDSGSNEYITSFNASTMTYNITVPNNVPAVNISATVADTGKATLSGPTGNQALSEGNNGPFNILVTSEDISTTKTYTINIRRESSNNRLSNLSISSTPSGTFSPAFNQNTFSGYTYTIGSNVDTITITAALADPSATITDVSMPGATLSGLPMPASGGTATYINVVNDQVLTISVESESGVTSTYAVTIVKAKSTNTNLATLTVSEGTINPTFIPGTTAYNVVVASGITDIDVTATAEDSRSTIAITSNATTYPGGTGIPLATGNNTIVVRVTAEDTTQTKDYTLTIRRLSNDSSLSNLSLSGITLSPTFASGTTTYNMTVPFATSSTNVTATTTSTTATIVAGGTGSWSLSSIDPTVNTRQVVVQAENCQSTYTGIEPCSSTTYTLNVTRTAPSTNADLSSLTVDGTSVPSFDPDTTTYNLATVGNSVTSINIAAVVADTGKATLSGDTGTQSLAEGDNTFTITVTAENGSTKDYTINIRRKSSNNRLSSLTLSSTPAGVFAPTFNPTTFTGYTYTIDPDTDTITITAALADPSATITGVTMPGATLSGSPMPTTGGSATYTNVANDQVITITTLSEDNGVNNYVITIVKTQSINADLATLTVSEGTLTPTFVPGTTAYTVNVGTSVTSIDVTATTAHSAATVAGTGTHSPLNYGPNTVTVTVTAENTAITKNYVITVNRAYKTDAAITNLQTDVSGTMATVPGFPDTSNTYDLGTVPFSKTALDIAVTTNDADASVTGDGSRALSVGPNNLTVTVTAQDGVTSINYTLTVTRTAASTNANLSDLSTDGTTVPSFDPDTTTYNLATVSNSVTSINIAAVVADTGKATLSGELGTQALAEGDNTFTITVTAEAGNTKNYTINIRRQSSNNYLSSLAVSSGALSPTFNKTTLDYDVSVSASVTTITITPTPEDSSATVSPPIVSSATLSPGPNIFTFTVTAENGATRTYTVTVDRSLSNNANLSNLTVSEGTLTPPFSPTEQSYTVNVANNITNIVLAATEDDPAATVVGDGTKTLAVGDNIFNIVVTAENGNIKTYQVNVIRARSDNNYLASLSVTGYAITPAFDKDTSTYSLTTTVPNSVNNVVIVATAEDPSATISGDGTRSISVGSNALNVVVTAEDSSTKTYTVNVTRESASGTPETITSEVYGHTIDANYILTVTDGDYTFGTSPPGTFATDLKNQLDNDNGNLFIFASDGTTPITTEKISTGMIVKLIIDSDLKDQKSVILLGDVNGDGVIDTFDGVILLNHYLGLATITDGAKLIAADANKDDAIDTFDGVRILNHYLGILSLF